MAVYGISTRTTVTTATALTPILAFRGSTSQIVEIREIHLYNVTAPTTSGGIGLMRSATQGTASASVTTSQPRIIGAGTSDVILETAWSSAPTVGAVGTVMRRWHHGTAIGNGVIWAYDLTAPLVIPISPATNASMILVNLQGTAAATYEVTVVYNV